MEKSLDYKDIYLVPEYSELSSRSKADTTTKLGNFEFKIPVVPSNMKTVIDDKWAKWLSDKGYFYIMHRFDNTTIAFTKKAQNFKFVSISTGVNEDSLEELQTIKKKGYRLDYVTIDVAHGHHSKVQARIQEIKDLFPNVFIIAGNVTTPEGIEALESWGANATRVGIGPGRACTTRFQTGFHIPMFSALQECSKVAKTPIFADGGINHYGDIAKALAGGASWVMAGSLFASCTDSPAPTLNGRKVYYGSASYYNKGHKNHIEGTLLELELADSLDERIQQITQALQSSISYAGGTDLKCFNGLKYVTIK